MAKKVYDIAQTVENNFYQDFRPEDAFFEIDDFARLVADERDAMMEQEFYAQIKANDNTFPRINPQWVKHEFLEIKFDDDLKRHYVEICTPIYEFPMDERGMGIQDVYPMGSGCSDFIRIQQNLVWAQCMSATLDVVFYSVQGCRVYLDNFDGVCTKKLDVLIVPSQGHLPISEQTVPDGKAAPIREAVLQKLFRDYAAKLGKIDFTIDGNSNPNPNESGKVYDNLKTK